jgi:phenylacetate-CoA ligase
MLIVRGVNLFPSQIEEQVLKCAALAPHYEIEVSRPNRTDDVLVRVEARPGATDADVLSAATDLAEHVKNIVGLSIRVDVAAPNTLGRSQGKAKRVIDTRHL